MTDDLIKRADEVLDNVTPGPWVFEGGDIFGRNPDGFTVEVASVETYRDDEFCTRDIFFIATARQLVPDLRDEVLRLRADLTRVTAERDAEQALVYLLNEATIKVTNDSTLWVPEWQVWLIDANAALAAYAKHKEGR